MNPFRKKDQSEIVQVAPAQPVAVVAPDIDSLDSSLEGTQPVNVGAIQAQEDAVNPLVSRLQTVRRRRRILRYSLIALLLIAGGVLFFVRLHTPAAQSNLNSSANQRYSTQSIKLGDISASGGSLLGTSGGGSGSVNVNGQLNVNSALVLSPIVQPSSGVAGQLYFDSTTNQLEYYNGTAFNALASQSNILTSLGGATGALNLGNGLSTDGTSISNTGVLSLQGETGNVAFDGGDGISIDGTTVTNTGVLALGGRGGAIDLGNGLSLTGNTLQNSGVTGLTAGANITVTNTGNGNFTIASTAGGGGSGTITGGGTVGNIPLYSVSGTNIADSIISQSGGSSISISGAVTATSFSGNGSGLTSLNASQLTTGTVPSSVLSGAYGGITGVGTIASGTWQGTAIALGYGGTGATSFATNNGVVYYNGTKLVTTSAGNSSECLLSNGGSSAPSFGPCPGASNNPTLQNVYTNSAASPSITLGSLGGGLVLQDAAIPVGGNLFTVKANGVGGTNYLNVTANGTTINGGLAASGTIAFGSLTGAGNALAVISNSGAVSRATIDLGSLPSYISGTLNVGNGGTGASSFTSANGVIYYNGSALVNTGAGSSGECLLANSSGVPTFGTCTGAGGVSSITANNTAQTGALQLNGTTNQISVTNSGSTFTFATPQSIATTSDVQFNSVNATTLLKTAGVTRIDASGNFTGNDLTTGGTVTLNNLHTNASSTCLVLGAGNTVGTASCATGTGSSPTLQDVYDNSATAATPNILLDSVAGGVTIQDSSTPVGGNLLAVTSNDGSTTYLGVTSGGVAVTGSLSATDDVTFSKASLKNGNTSGECLSTDSTGSLVLVTCAGGAGGPGAVNSINGQTGAITLNNASNSSTTITIDNASTTQKGIAKFTSNNFSDDGAGTISIKTGGVTTTEIKDGTIANGDLSSGTFTNITGTGILTAGSIASGFGSIVTGNDITGNNLKATNGVYTGSTATQRIDTNGNLINIHNITANGAVTVSSGGSLVLNNLTPGANQCLVLYTNTVSTDNCPTAPSVPTPTLQNVYDASTTPNIALNNINGGIMIQDAATSVGAIFQITNNAGTTPYFAVGTTGSAVLGNFSASGSIQFTDLASTSGGVVFANPDGTLTTTTDAGTAGDCLVSNGSGNAPGFAACPGGGGLPKTGSATDNHLTKFANTATDLTDSQIADNGSHVSVGGTGTTGGLFNVGTSDQFQVSGAGAITGVGLDAGTGLIQGSGGLTLDLTSSNLTLNNAPSGSATSCLVLDASNHVVTTTCAAGTGGSPSGSYILNQTGLQSSANFNIDGTGKAGTSFLSPIFDSISGGLSIGNGNATSVGIGKSGVTTTITGNLIQQTGTFSLTGNGASTIATSSGTLGITGDGAVTIATDAKTAATAGITIKSGDASVGSNLSAGTILIDTGTKTGLGTAVINIGTANATAINIGNSTNTGTIAANGNVQIAANKNLTLQSGTGTITQTYVNSTGSATTVGSTNNAAGGTVNAVNINAAGTNASGSNTVNALNFGSASNSAGGTTTFNGLNFGTGYTNLLQSANASLTAGGVLTLGSSSNTGAVSIANNSATTTLNITTSAAPTIGVISVNDSSGTSAADILLNLQSGKFTVDGNGDVIANGTYNTNTFNGTTLTFGGAATIRSAAGANALGIDTGGSAVLSLGTGNASSVNISRTGQNTLVNGTLTASQLLTASNGLTITAGQLTNGGSTLNTAFSLGNLNFSGSGNTGSIAANQSPADATTTVDVHTSFVIPQTTAGQTFTIPSPTATTAGRIIYVSNTGSTTFTIAGVTVPANANATFLWNGTSWAASSVSVGASVVGTIDTGSPSSDGATIIGNTLYLQSASISNPGLVNKVAQSFVGLKTFTSGITAGGGAVSINDSSNFNTSINTGTSTGTVNIGNSATTGFTLESGTAAINLFNGNTNHTISLATGTGVQTLTIGSTNSTSGTTINGGSNGISLQASTGTIAIGTTNPNVVQIGAIGATGNTSTIHIADTTGNATQTITIGQDAQGGGNAANNKLTLEGGSGTQGIQIGNSGQAHGIQIGTGAGVETVKIGSTTSSSTTTLQAGSGGISLSGNTSISGSNTFSTGTGAVSLQGATSVTGSNTFSVGTGLTSLGGGLNVASTSTASNGVNITSALTTSGSYTAKILNVSDTNSYNGTTADSGNLLSLSRALTATSGTTTLTGAVANLQSSCTQSGGTCTDSSNVLNISQLFAFATGAALNVSNNGGGSGILITQSHTTGSNAAITVNYTASIGTDKLISLQNNSTPKFTVDANGNVVALGTATIGANGGTNGAITFNGSTSGSVTLGAQAAAGSATILLPTSVGSANDCLANSGTAGTLTFTNCGASSANKTLSNLTSPTAINQDLLPGTTNTLNFGNASSTWATGYFGSHLYAPDVDVAAAGPMTIGSTNASSITVGSTSTTGTLTLGQSTANNTIAIGNANLTANTQTISIGTGSSSTGKDLVTIGSTNGASATTIQGGSGSITLSVGASTTNSIILTGGTGGGTVGFTAAGGLVATGTARHTKTITLPAEYAGAALDATNDTGGANCFTNNNGIMTSGYSGDSSPQQNFYQWSSSVPSTSECYDVVVQVPIPTDFDGWTGSPSLYVSNTASTTSSVCMQAYVSAGVLDSAYSSGTYSCAPAMGSTLTARSFTALTSSTASYSASGLMTIKIRMTSSDVANLTKIGTLTLTYNSKF